MTANATAPFWETKALTEMSRSEWESLCDGCGQCCLFKFEDDETGDVIPTCIACRFLDLETCRCRHYQDRQHLVPACLTVSPLDQRKMKALPDTCAYRRLFEGKKLPACHPLLTGDPESVHRAGLSVRGKVLSEENIHPDDFNHYILE